MKTKKSLEEYKKDYSKFSNQGIFFGTITIVATAILLVIVKDMNQIIRSTLPLLVVLLASAIYIIKAEGERSMAAKFYDVDISL